MKYFEHDLVNLISNVELKNVSSPFQRSLNETCKKIKQNKNLIIPADKTTNFYEVKPKTYDDLLNKHIQKDYKIEKSCTVNKINQAHIKIVHDLDLEDRVFKTAERPAFITMKDHKPNFENNPTCRLLNPCKPEIGKINKRLLENINSYNLM